MPVTDADIDLYYPGKGPSGQDRRYWENYLLKLLRADIASGGGGGAPSTAEYITSASDAGLSAERVLTDSATVTWDFTTPGQAIANATGGGGGLTLTTVEKDLGSVPVNAGTFTISGAGLSVGKPVLITQASGAYTGKGTLPDEAEMDPITANAYVFDATTIRAYWQSNHGPVRGNIKFNYAVSA
jgi:hypothetical protein